MRTAGSLYSSVSQTSSSRKAPVKRRKLNTAASTHSEHGTAAKVATPSGTASETTFVTCGRQSILPIASRLSCSSCHRALSSGLCTVLGSVVTCARCLAPTCTICARTCTSYIRPSSFPPTPALTRSPTPSPTSGNTVHSSGQTPLKRAALGPSLSVMNCDACDIPSMKRKKAPTEKDERDVEIKTCDQLSSTHLCEVVDDSTVSMILPGCGRIICRACCVESVANDGTLCIDCYALV